jgi:hypothetical protein
MEVWGKRPLDCKQIRKFVNPPAAGSVWAAVLSEAERSPNMPAEIISPLHIKEEDYLTFLCFESEVADGWTTTSRLPSPNWSRDENLCARA